MAVNPPTPLLTVTERTHNRGEALNKRLDQHAFETKVAEPCTVTAVHKDPHTGALTVTVRLGIKERARANDGTLTDVKLPDLVDVPVELYRGGGFSMTLPVHVGTEGHVVFHDKNHDAWLQSGGVQKQMDIERHGLNNAHFRPGLCSNPKSLKGYSQSSAQIRSDDGACIIDIASGKITITGPHVEIGGSTIIDKRVFLNHTHKDVQKGGDVTGGVV